MTSRTTKPASRPQLLNSITGCSIQNTVKAEANEHTRAAVEALANAAAENAKALAAIAAVLKPAPAHFGTGIHFGDINHD